MVNPPVPPRFWAMVRFWPLVSMIAPPARMFALFSPVRKATVAPVAAFNVPPLKLTVLVPPVTPSATRLAITVPPLRFSVPLPVDWFPMKMASIRS